MDHKLHFFIHICLLNFQNIGTVLSYEKSFSKKELFFQFCLQTFFKVYIMLLLTKNERSVIFNQMVLQNVFNLPVLHSPCYQNPHQVIRVSHHNYVRRCLTHGLAAPIKSQTHTPCRWITQKTFNGVLLLSRNSKLPILFLILSPTHCNTWQTPWHRVEFK